MISIILMITIEEKFDPSRSEAKRIFQSAHGRRGFLLDISHLKNSKKNFRYKSDEALSTEEIYDIFGKYLPASSNVFHLFFASSNVFHLFFASSKAFHLFFEFPKK